MFLRSDFKGLDPLLELSALDRARELARWGRQFAELQARYGPWGLAFLEALVRIADWQVSEEEQRDDNDVDRGLQPNNPLAVMAAYSVLRLLPDATVRWSGTHPELSCDGDPVRRLASLLPERMSAPENTILD